MGNEQLEAGNIGGERNAGENRRVRLNCQNGTIAAAMCSPRLVKEVLNTRSGSSWLTMDADFAH